MVLSLGECGRGGASMSVAVWSGSRVAWERELVALKERIGPVFGRAETRATAGAFMEGMMSGVARKTGWLLADQAGLERPYRMQSLLGRSHWDADALRDRSRRDAAASPTRVRGEVIEVLGYRDGVLLVDETGFLKKGEHSVGVARQYSGTAGRIENCQVGVFLARVPGLCQPLRAGPDRPTPVPAGRLGPGRKQAGQGWRAGGDHLRTQAADGLRGDCCRARCRRALCLGAGGRPVWVGLAAAPHAGDTGAALRARGALQPPPARLDRGGAGGDPPRGDGRCPCERGLGDARGRRGIEGAALDD